MIPLEDCTSAVVTVAVPIETVAPLTPNFAFSPFAMVATIPSLTALDGTDAVTTW